jgi:hypothetical protein
VRIEDNSTELRSERLDPDSAARQARREKMLAAMQREGEIQLQQIARQMGYGESTPARRQRKLSDSRVITAAKKVGASSVTTPSGYTVRFIEIHNGETVTPLEEWRAKRRGQGQS